MHEEVQDQQETQDEKPKAPKVDKYLALVRSDDGVLSAVKAPNASGLKKALTDIPIKNIVEIWKGKARPVEVEESLKL